MPQAKEILADKNGSKLVDIRSWDEHIGKIPGYSDIIQRDVQQAQFGDMLEVIQVIYKIIEI